MSSGSNQREASVLDKSGNGSKIVELYECDSEEHKWQWSETAIMACLVDDICDDLFAGCDGITSLVLPEGITSIGQSAFASQFTGGMG